MDKLALGPIDVALIVLYLLAVVGLGLWFSRGIKSSKDFFLAGKSLPWWAVGMSLVVSDIGAKDMIGLAADGYRYGLVMMNWDFIGCIFPVLVAAFLIMPFLWMAGVYTIPEYLGRRYNQHVRAVFAVVWTLSMIATIATIYVSAATMFEVLLGWNFWFSVGLTAVAVAIFTTAGGLKAVVITDSLSCVVLIVGASLICLLGLRAAGGFSGLQETVGRLDWTEHHLQMLLPADHPKYPWPAVLLGLGFVLGPAYWIGNQAIVQRTLGTKSQSQARASFLFCAAIKLIFPVLLVVPGLIGVALLHTELGVPTDSGELNNQVLPRLVVQLLPTGVLGIVLGAFLAGVLANLDSYVNSASTLIVTDLFRPLRPEATDRQCLRIGRWLVIGLLLGGVLLAYPVRNWCGSVFEAFQSVLALFQGPLLALLLLGMLTGRVTQWGGLAGMIVGLLSSVVMYASGPILGEAYAVPYLWVAWWSFVVSIVVTVVVSLFTAPYERKRLAGLVCWIPAEENTP